MGMRFWNHATRCGYEFYSPLVSDPKPIRKRQLVSQPTTSNKQQATSPDTYWVRNLTHAVYNPNFAAVGAPLQQD